MLGSARVKPLRAHNLAKLIMTVSIQYLFNSFIFINLGYLFIYKYIQLLTQSQGCDNVYRGSTSEENEELEIAANSLCPIHT